MRLHRPADALMHWKQAAAALAVVPKLSASDPRTRRLALSFARHGLMQVRLMSLSDAAAGDVGETLGRVLQLLSVTLTDPLHELVAQVFLEGSALELRRANVGAALEAAGRAMAIGRALQGEGALTQRAGLAACRVLAASGNRDDAARLAHEVFDAARGGEDLDTAGVLVGLGLVFVVLGEIAPARAALAQSLALYEAVAGAELAPGETIRAALADLSKLPESSPESVSPSNFARVGLC